MEKQLVKKIENTGVYVQRGDICRIPTDAIITPINSEGLWDGGIDGAIERVAGNLYHSQARRRMPLKNLQTVVSRGIPGDINRGCFRDVVFVIDDLQSPLEEVVYTGLETANEEGYERILLPTMRMGVMSGVVEKLHKKQ
jgi:O-acetyl-ADP-ribose deacetylase (regulator of RNase III)